MGGLPDGNGMVMALQQWTT